MESDYVRIWVLAALSSTFIVFLAVKLLIATYQAAWVLFWLLSLAS